MNQLIPVGWATSRTVQIEKLNASHGLAGATLHRHSQQYRQKVFADDAFERTFMTHSDYFWFGNLLLLYKKHFASTN